MNSGLQLISIAPQADPARPDAGASHFIGFQRDLAAAAGRLGHDFLALVPEGVPPDDWLLPVLPRGALGRKVFFEDSMLVRAIDRAIEGVTAAEQRRVIVLRYEGKLQELPIFAELASRHPSVRFIWNLLASPAGLRLPDGLSIPGNLTVVSDNDERHVWARRRGIPSGGVWPLHSSVAADPERGPHVPRAGEPVRILVAIAGWQSDRSVRAHVDYVIRRARRSSRPGQLIWTIAGQSRADSPHGRWAARMQDSDVRVLAGALPSAEYAALFATHQAVWFPAAGTYGMKSSGKAIDALASGCVVVAPVGSFHARESARWLPADLTHATPDEAAAVLAGLPERIDALLGALEGSRGARRAAYDATACLERLIAAVGPTEADLDALAAPGVRSPAHPIGISDTAPAGHRRPAAPVTWVAARLRAGRRD